MIWDMFGMLLITFDAVVTPFNLAFNPPEDNFSRATFWLILFFWSVDMGLSCITGFYDHGEMELRPRMIFRAYASSWMMLDIIVVGNDWAIAYMEVTKMTTNEDEQELIGMARTLR